jgi:hypothetical protein
MSITDIIIDVIIRSVAPANTARIQRICESELDPEPDGGDLPAILHHAAGSAGIVAETGSKIVGACFGSLDSGPDRALAGHIELVAVSRTAAGAGMGRRLLSSMETCCGDRERPPFPQWQSARLHPAGRRRQVHGNDVPGVARGYQRYRDAVDMAVDLRTADLGTEPAGRMSRP